MSEEYLVRYGSPTLAGIKTASLFQCPAESEAAAAEELADYNRTLIPRGLYIIPLKWTRGRVLIYMFRPAKLTEDLSHPMAAGILREKGYLSKSVMGLIAELRNRVRNGDEFPHEIGLFLGYPPEDVKGFMEQSAAGYKTLGPWKVYGDSRKAEECLSKYRCCTRIYSSLILKGRSLTDLTVAM